MQTDPALIDRFCEPADADAGMNMGFAPACQNCVHGLADYFPFSLRAETQLIEKIISDLYAQ